MQTGRTIIENQDGTMEGTVTWKADSTDLNAKSVDSSDIFPKIATNDGRPGDIHPDDDRLECYNRTITFGSHNIATCVASYFGLKESETPPTITFTGGVTTEPIETHPNFKTFGTQANGAQFDDDDRFLRFSIFVGGTDNRKDSANFYGVTSYLTPSTNITLSWWSTRKPTPSKLASITPFLPKEARARKPTGVADYLLLSESIKQVGNFYQITQQYMGSILSGWNPEIYDGL